MTVKMRMAKAWNDYPDGDAPQGRSVHYRAGRIYSVDKAVRDRAIDAGRVDVPVSGERRSPVPTGAQTDPAKAPDA